MHITCNILKWQEIYNKQVGCLQYKSHISISLKNYYILTKKSPLVIYIFFIKRMKCVAYNCFDFPFIWKNYNASDKRTNQSWRLPKLARIKKIIRSSFLIFLVRKNNQLQTLKYQLQFDYVILWYFKLWLCWYKRIHSLKY